MSPRALTLDLLPGAFAVARLAPDSEIPPWARGGAFVSVTRTGDELSLVCTEASVPPNLQAQRGLRCLRVLGPLDFSETGVLASLANPLAGAGISLFAVSTYETDYLFLTEVELEAALQALSEAGHSIRRFDPA